MRLIVATASLLLASSPARLGSIPTAAAPGPPREAAPTGAINPELETMTRAVAIQARPDQVGYFHSAIASTDVALQQSRELQTLGSAANSTPDRERQVAGAARRDR